MSDNDQNFAEISQDDFDKRLQVMVEDEINALLSIPGVYEILSEHYNNEIIEEYEEENDHFMDFKSVNAMFEDSYTPREFDILKMTDPIMLREQYNNYTDMLCKDGTISDFAYNNWDNPY